MRRDHVGQRAEIMCVGGGMSCVEEGEECGWLVDVGLRLGLSGALISMDATCLGEPPDHLPRCLDLSHTMLPAPPLRETLQRLIAAVKYACQ